MIVSLNRESWMRSIQQLYGSSPNHERKGGCTMTEREEIMKEFGMHELNDDQLIRCLANQLRKAIGELKDLDRALSEVEKVEQELDNAKFRRNSSIYHARKLAKEYA